MNIHLIKFIMSKILYVTALVALVTACSPTTTPTTEVVVQPPVPTPTLEPTFTPSPSPTNTPIPSPTAIPEPTPTPVPQASLSGRILDQETGQSIAGTQVSAGMATITTDDNGRYSLTGLEPGQYVLSVTHPDYDPGLSKIFTVVGGQDLLLDLALYAPDTSPYPKDPMLTNPLDPNGAPTKEDAERLAREQGLTGEVVSIDETHLSGEYLVNYKIGGDIRAAVAELNHEAWELTDDAGRTWRIIKVCGNLASPLPKEVPIATPVPRLLPPLAEVLVDGLVVRTCAAEECAEVGTVPRGVQVEVFGCLAEGGDWCEVGWSGGRGWCTGQSLRQLAMAAVIPQAAPVLPTQTPIPTIQSGEVRLDTRNVPLVNVPAGPFTMGKNYADPSGLFSSDPAHTVVLNAFYIDRYEVANDQFASFLNEQGNQIEGGVTWLDAEDEYVRIHIQDGIWQPDEGYTDHPVVDVSWYGARAYCQWRGARLPTEAEWEKAARGTDERIYPWGNSASGCSHAHLFACAVSSGTTAPVGSHPVGVSPYGAHDMGGNVYEWVNDWFDPNYYADAPRQNPIGPSEGHGKVIRGGSFHFGGPEVTSRGAEDGIGNPPPDTRTFHVGFRCAQ